MAFAALPPEVHPDFSAALTTLLERYDHGGGRGLVVSAAYLETVITR